MLKVPNIKPESVQDASPTTKILFINPRDPSSSFIHEIDAADEDFISMNEVLSQIVNERNLYVKVVSSMGQPIPTNETVSYLRNLQPFYIVKQRKLNNTGDEKDEGFVAKFKTLTGKSIEIETHDFESIYHVKEKLYRKEGIPPEQQRLILGGQELEDESILADYDINEETVLHLVLKLRGPGGTLNKVVEISEEGRPVVKDKSKNSREWRSLTQPGLCIEGRCKNKECTAYRKSVVISKGFGTYDVFFDSHKNYCPMCFEPITPENYAFYDCTFKYIATKIVKGWPKKKTISQETFKIQKNKYQLFDSGRLKSETWHSFKFITVSSQDEDLEKFDNRCIVCRENMANRELKFKCGHKIHRSCNENIKDLSVKCSACYY